MASLLSHSRTMTKQAEMELQRTLGSIETTLAQMAREFADMRSEQKASHENSDSRLKVLEKWKTYTMAFAAGISGTLLVVSGLVWRLLSLVK